MQSLALKITKYFVPAIILLILLLCVPSIKINKYDIVAIVVVVVAIQIFLNYISKKQDCQCDYPPINSCENFDNSVSPKPESKENKTAEKTKSSGKTNKIDDDEYENSDLDEETDIPYSQLSAEHYERMGITNNPNRKSHRDPKYKGTYGDWFIPPEEWYPPCTRPPVCVTNNGCPVQPVYTDGTHIDLREYDNSRRITNPENISIPYIKKLNGGKIKKLRKKKKKKILPTETYDA